MDRISDRQLRSQLPSGIELVEEGDVLYLSFRGKQVATFLVSVSQDKVKKKIGKFLRRKEKGRLKKGIIKRRKKRRRKYAKSTV